MKKKNAVMLADTRIPLVGNILLQLKNTNEGLFDEAIIYYKTISEKDKKTLNSIMPCKFVEFKHNFTKNILGLENFKKFSELMFARYNMFNYLDEYETITWLDTDIVIKDKLDDLIEKSKITGMVANFETPEDCSFNKVDYVQTCFNTPIRIYDMNKYNMSSGLIVISDKIKSEIDYTKWLYEKTYEYADLLILPDQGILNIFIQEFNINVTPAGEKGAYCFYPSYKRDSSNAIIIHAWGSRKFWNNQYLMQTYPEWKSCYDKWLEIGGSELNQDFNPIVSIVIPCYKPNLELMEDALRTLVVDQQDENGYTYENSEIIIVTEPFEVEGIKKLISKFDDSRIRLIVNEERMGIAKSLNIGIKNARGKYIARMDDDDLATSRRIYKQVKYLDEHDDVHLVTTDFEYIGDMWERRFSFEREMSKAWSIFTCPFDHPTIMFKKEFFIKNNLFYDESRGFVEDWELWLRAFDKGMVVGNIPEVLFYHRWHNGSAGQNNKTIIMMQELIQKNFEKLNVNIKKEDLKLIGPWNGKISEKEIQIVKSIFEKALENNKKLKLYNQFALEKVFTLRLYECEHGYLKGLFEKTNISDNGIYKKRPLYKRIIIKFARIIYNPLKYRFENIINNSLSETNNKIDSMNYHINELTNINNTLMKNNAYYNRKSNEILENLSEMKQIIIEQKKEIDNLHDQIYIANSKIKNINELVISNITPTKKILLIGTSEHENIGDAAISVGELNFLKKYFNDRIVIEISTYEYSDKESFIKSIITDDDIIILQGGGNLGNKFLLEENLRRNVIKTFKNNKIIILPQTIHFETSESGIAELEKSKLIYNNHNNLKLLLRGNKSLEFAKKHFPNTNPQVAMDLTTFINKDYNYDKKGILLCLRDINDESGFTKEEYNKIINIIKNKDENFVQTNNLHFENILKEKKSNVVDDELNKFAKKELIVTDRLHGLLFSIITKTPCIVMSSYNNKIEEFYEQIKDSNAIIYIDKNIAQIEESMKILSKVKKPIYPNINVERFNEIYNIIKNEDK